MLLLLLKLALTVPVAALLTQPLWAPQWGAGILGEVAAFGPVGGIAAVLAFLALVALYCVSLQRLFEAIAPQHRAAAPRSVWLMFVIPYNFVEDFFIVGNLAASLRRDGRTAAGRRRLWLWLGMSWAGLQIVSLLPGPLGVAAGVVALAGWAVHWRLTHAMTRSLRQA